MHDAPRTAAELNESHWRHAVVPASVWAAFVAAAVLAGALEAPPVDAMAAAPAACLDELSRCVP
jgi:hypothetical protein